MAEYCMLHILVQERKYDLQRQLQSQRCVACCPSCRRRQPAQPVNTGDRPLTCPAVTVTPA